ncbi:MAG TPA: response regulator [Limnobacter sp.]|uniref:response regulator n=2 Tax=Limnobacter sp. TaxID=2003368 RepID=UPI002E2EC5FA|nr:response regulator [Limnobacter sp.]HEX5486205.1 response regulator [Limnobacter sp.]
MGQINQFIPHGFCIAWNIPLLTLHVVSDALIAIAYFSIPAGLLYVASRRKGGALHGVYYLFAAFIMACGFTHLMGIVTLWYPLYYLDGLLKLLTAVVSVATALYLLPKLPMVLSLPNLDELMALNQQLSNENARRRQVESTLIEEKEKALALQRAQADFLANMSHEIRTPMNGIVGALSLLNETPLNAAQSELLNITRKSASSLVHLLNDVLDASKMESGQLLIRENELNLPELLEEVAQTLNAEAESKGIELVCPTGYVPETPLLGDEVRLKQVLFNLIANAIKFTKIGQVKVNVILTSTESQMSEVRFEVVDSGPGMSQSDQQKLFERFSQVDLSLAQAAQGTGLGLAISRQLVHLMGGRIGVDSQAGVGSMFWFTLPLKRALKPPKLRAYGPRFLEGVQTAVCSPLPALQEYLVSVLSRFGACVDCFDSMKDLLNHDFEVNKRPELVVLDRQALGSRIDLESVIAQVRDTGQAIKVVCISSQAGHLHEIERIEHWADAYLIKPLAQHTLLQKVAHLFASDFQVTANVPAPAVPQFNARVLLVEDHPVNQKVEKGILEKFGLQVEIAENGQQALDQLSDGDFDLVLMDCQMPVMDGLEATRRIRAEGSSVKNRQIPVIALTAQFLKSDRIACLDAGMNDYMSKPFEPGKLKEMLQRWLG